MVELVWNDHYGLLERKLPLWGRKSVAEDIIAVFRDVGIVVRFTGDSNEPRNEAGSIVVRIVLVPRTGEAWRIPPEAMGAVLDRRSPSRTLYVFFPSLLRGVGDRTGPSRMLHDPREVREIAKALARVVTHEVVHALDPLLPHAPSEGVMSPRLTRQMLRGDRLPFTEATAAGLAASLPERR